MKHIKEPPPPLPSELPPNVRKLIEITLVKNPGMRYRSGGPFADAVAAVRAGRRPPRPSQITAGRPGLPGRDHSCGATPTRIRPDLYRPQPMPNRSRPRRAVAAAPGTTHILVGPTRAAVGRGGAWSAGDHHRGAYRHQLTAVKPSRRHRPDRHRYRDPTGRSPPPATKTPTVRSTPAKVMTPGL